MGFSATLETARQHWVKDASPQAEATPAFPRWLQWAEAGRLHSVSACLGAAGAGEATVVQVASIVLVKVSLVDLQTNAMEQGTLGAGVEVGARADLAHRAPNLGYRQHPAFRALTLRATNT
jgi:hypothetical protein